MFSILVSQWSGTGPKACSVTDDWILRPCPQPSPEHASAAEARQNALTKPPGSLGILERLVVRLAALQRTERPCAGRAPIILFAGDHGVCAQGVSAYPSAVTVEMLHNFANGGAAISVLARELGLSLEVVDAGTLSSSDIAGVVSDKPARGTRDFTREPAMTPDELLHALGAGARAHARANQSGADLIILGEMGIGNTTSASAIAAALLARPPADLVGAGTGLDTDGIARKANVIAAALDRHGMNRPGVAPLDVMARVGGLEIAALTGAMIAAAQAGTPVLVDGFIVSAAALAAVRLNPSCANWLLFSHRSQEQGHRLVLDALGAEPILDLKLRLGEGTGAALALPVLRLACALHAQMATFEEAQVSRRGPCH
jgi:nicotinate-nucleotide--dimethylbenzimidazole phosphoribosyltransferase